MVNLQKEKTDDIQLLNYDGFSHHTANLKTKSTFDEQHLKQQRFSQFTPHRKRKLAMISGSFFVATTENEKVSAVVK